MRKLKHGEPPPPGVKEHIVRLAGSIPRPTNTKIREDVGRKHGVLLSDRTILRYCKEAGVSTNRRAARISERKPPPQGEVNRNHIQKLTVIAEQFREQLRLPPPSEAGSWVPPQGTRYGISTLPTGYLEGPESPSHYIWEPREKSQGTLKLAVEKDALYFPCLQAHLPDDKLCLLYSSYLHDHLGDGKLWSRFRKWKSTGPIYLFACRKLVEAMVHECQLITGAVILIDREWPQEGVFWEFVRQVYIHLTRLAYPGWGGFGGLAYGFDDAVSRLPEQGKLHVLKYAQTPIACHRDINELKKWQNVHQMLLGRDDFMAEAMTPAQQCQEPRKEFIKQAETLAGQYQELKGLGEPIKKVLTIEIERGKFDHRRCEICELD